MGSCSPPPSLRRRQSTTPGIDSLHNGSQKLVLVSRRFAEISVVRVVCDRPGECSSEKNCW